MRTGHGAGGHGPPGDLQLGLSRQPCFHCFQPTDPHSRSSALKSEFRTFSDTPGSYDRRKLSGGCLAVLQAGCQPAGPRGYPFQTAPRARDQLPFLLAVRQAWYRSSSPAPSPSPAARGLALDVSSLFARDWLVRLLMYTSNAAAPETCGALKEVPDTWA